MCHGAPPARGSAAPRRRFDPTAGTCPTIAPFAAEQLLVPSKRGQSVASRLNVYREQYWLRHLANLTDDYPTLAWVVGAEGFRELVTGYLAAFPPRTWNLQRLGADVPAYVADRAPWKRDPLAVDASVLDWAFMEAFDAPDAAPLDLRALVNATAEAWTQARIELHPSVQRGRAHPSRARPSRRCPSRQGLRPTSAVRGPRRRLARCRLFPASAWTSTRRRSTCSATCRRHVDRRGLRGGGGQGRSRRCREPQRERRRVVPTVDRERMGECGRLARRWSGSWPYGVLGVLP